MRKNSLPRLIPSMFLGLMPKSGFVLVLLVVVVVVVVVVSRNRVLHSLFLGWDRELFQLFHFASFTPGRKIST